MTGLGGFLQGGQNRRVIGAIFRHQLQQFGLEFSFASLGMLLVELVQFLGKLPL